MVSTVSEMSREFNVTSDTANSFSTSTMQSTEASRTNSQERILLQKRRIQHSSPRASNIRLAYQPSTRRPSRPYHPMTHPRCDEVTESVKQANRERVKALENELQVAQHKLNEVSTENRTLQKLLRRQEVTLKHYEGSETSLPHIMQAHDEDMRVMRALLKQEKRSTRELTRQLKCKDDELTPLRHEHGKLLQLARDRQLGERRQLAEQLERQEEVIREQGEKILTLTRRLMLESKSHAHRLGVEAAKTRDAQQQLSLAAEEGERLRRLADQRQRLAASNAHRRRAGGDSQAGSGVSLLAGTSFPGLAAHRKPDPSPPWHDISLPETESICSSISDLLYTFTGFALFLAAGILGVNYFRPPTPQDSPTDLLNANEAYITAALATGSVAICNSAVFLVDLLLSYKDVHDACAQDPRRCQP